MITFRKVKEPYGWLSNMSPHPVGKFPTAEHLFQSMRFANYLDNPIVQEIKSQKSPMAAKMVAKKYLDKAVIVPRSHLDLLNMQFVLILKLSFNPELIQQLIDTGDHEIVEDVTKRPNESGLFWGKAFLNGEWTGTNTLGKMWMEVRESLKRPAELKAFSGIVVMVT